VLQHPGSTTFKNCGLLRAPVDDGRVKPLSTQTDLCPFIDDDHPRCASHFTLDHLNEAFTQCIGGFRGCANYYRLARQHPQRIGLTCHGRALQPTGS
jgi:hypothetical protein